MGMETSESLDLINFEAADLTLPTTWGRPASTVEWKIRIACK